MLNLTRLVSGSLARRPLRDPTRLKPATMLASWPRRLSGSFWSPDDRLNSNNSVRRRSSRATSPPTSSRRFGCGGSGNKGVLTVKRGSGRNRLEEEIEITEEQFQVLWPATKGRRIKKRRHLVPLDGLTAEVDVYSGALADLITAEVEFDSIQESEAFDPPACFGDELTDDPRWSNQTLALHGRPSETA
jgi:adenylate cyclase